MSQTYRKRIYSRYTADRYPEALHQDRDHYQKAKASFLYSICCWLPPDKNTRCLAETVHPGIGVYTRVFIANVDRKGKR